MSDGTTTIRPPTPFKELDFFDEADGAMFAGRERETRQLVSRIINARAVVVHARSGLGKTSLLRAGVIPYLRQQHFLPVYVRTLDSLLGDLAEAVVHDCQLSPPAAAEVESRARQVIAAAAARGPVVLVLDQFEEFFTRFEHQPSERQAFVQFITGLVRDETCDVRVIFSLREDYLYALDEFQRKLPDLFAQALRLLPLTPLGARQAILRPLAAQNVPCDEELITQLVDELTGFEFDSARLQVTCSEVYRQALAGANGSVALKAKDLKGVKESAGTGLRGIYKRYLREAIRNIPPALHLDTRLLLDQLITAKRTKFAIAREALHQQFGDATRVDLVLAALQQQKLIRGESRGGKEWFELRHECLVEEILQWFKDDDIFATFRFVRRLIEENSREGYFRTHPEMLLTANQLSALAPLQTRLRPTPEELEYVLQSAIYALSPEIQTWAERQPAADTDSLLRTLIRSPLPQMRLGAIVAIGNVGTNAPDLAEFCLELALDKNTPKDIQAAARGSAAKIVPETDPRIRKLLTRVVGRTPPLMREFMADLYEAGRMRRAFNWLQLQLTVRQIERRRYQAHWALRTSFVARGLEGGLWGGVSAALPVLLVALWLMTREPNGFGSTASLSLATSGILGCAAFVGIVMGSRNGAAAYRACTMGTTRWRTAAGPSVPFLFVSPMEVSPPELTWVSRVLRILLVTYLAGFSLYIAWWPFLTAILAPLVGLVEPLIRNRCTRRSRILWSAMVCLTPAVALAIAFPFEPSDWPEAWPWILGILMGLLCLLHINLCSFSFAFPDGGIQGAQPLDPAPKTGSSKH